MTLNSFLQDFGHSYQQTPIINPYPQASTGLCSRSSDRRQCTQSSYTYLPFATPWDPGFSRFSWYLQGVRFPFVTLSLLHFTALGLWLISSLLWILVLYSPPSIIVQYSSHAFNIFQGTHLSSILLILSIEPLAMVISDNPNIIGVLYTRLHFKLNLFTDDALLVLTSPHTTLLNLQQVLAQFADISGLYLNPSKSNAVYTR